MIISDSQSHYRKIKVNCRNNITICENIITLLTNALSNKGIEYPTDKPHGNKSKTLKGSFINAFNLKLLILEEDVNNYNKLIKNLIISLLDDNCISIKETHLK